MTLSEWTPLNKEQAEALFAEHAVLLCENDGILVNVAAQILPPETVAYIRTWQGGKYWNSAGLCSLLPDGMVDWLTKAGFMAAVSAANCLHAWPEQRAAYLERQAEWTRGEAEAASTREAKQNAARERRKARAAARKGDSPA